MEYKIIGEPMPIVTCELEAGESMFTERGSMVWMSPNMEMQTNAGGLGKAFGRMFSGESIFQNIYTARGGRGSISFGSSFPGAIRAVEITPDRHERRGAVCLLPEKDRRRLLRRRRLHHAEALRTRSGFS